MKHDNVHICLIASELLGFGTAGGFGFATRSLGRNLVERGHRVTVVIPQPVGMSDAELVLDGITVRTFARAQILRSDTLFKAVNADIYHSQEPSLSSHIAQRAVPQAIHVVTCRDPRNFRDWCIEFWYPSHTRLGLLRTAAFYENPLTRSAVRNAAGVFVPAKSLVQKVQQKYQLEAAPQFMPTPITLPAQPVVKADRPTLCYVGRLDRRKRPDQFLALAADFPQAEFLVAGTAQDPRYGDELAARFGHVPNIRMLGFIDQFSSDALSTVFADAWIMVNTAAREGLPNVFIEAAAHGCAIVSPHDPDGFASQFGWHSPNQDYHAAITNLLKDDLWRERGQAGAAYAANTNSSELATNQHLAAYAALLDARRSQPV
jgi:glycosyltransferase involved in cell wall biosynthesis